MTKKLAGSTILGSGTDVLALNLSEDAYLGDAQFTVSVDNVQIGGTQTVTAIHGASTQEFDVLGTFAAGSHTVTVNYLNDYYDASGDRNLYVDSATIDGAVVAGGILNEYDAGPQSFSFVSQGNAVVPPPSTTPGAGTTLGAGPNDLILNLSEDAYQGDAQFRVSVDGRQIGLIPILFTFRSGQRP